MAVSMEQRTEWDVVVVGASFAGLSFASVAATHGLRVLVLERDQTIGGIVRTTGVLFSDVLTLIDVPQRYLMNAVRTLHIQLPAGDPLVVQGGAYRFFMADVTGMLQWMGEMATGHGATIRCGTTCTNATPLDGDRMTIGWRQGGAEGSTTTRLLVGADGAHSTVARLMGLDQNSALLAGAEWIVDGVDLDRETFSLIMNPALAPGYCLWLAPHADKVAIGVAGHQRSFKPNDSIEQAVKLFSNVADFSQMRIVTRKGGSIPVGGALRRVYRHDTRGHALLLGDAAGLCGAATGGGIYPALLSAPLAAHAVATELLNGRTGAITTYLTDLPRTGGLGPYLRVEDLLRRALDLLHTNEEAAAFYSLFKTPEGYDLLKRALFDTPIISMNNQFFRSLRLLLGKRPAFYGAAVRSVFAYLGARR